MKGRALYAALAFAALCPGALAADIEAPLLTLESRILLGEVRGRIDHLALDPARQRLYIAELGNDSLGVMDLASGTVIRRLGKLDEPQGVGFSAAAEQVLVASGGDGTLRRYRADSFEPLGTVALGSDADNLRIDAAGKTAFVGHGSGALAIVDTGNPGAPQSIALPAHPEGFQADADGRRVYVNIPSAHVIAVVDIPSRKVTAQWDTGSLRSNYPMALSPDGKTLWAGFRSPARLAAFDTASGRLLQAIETCGDTDDVFFDARRKWIYVICGSGEVDIHDATDKALPRIARIPTRGGARTGVFATERDRLYVAAPATSSEPAAVFVFRPAVQP